MSFASILSGPTDEQPPKKPSPPSATSAAPAPPAPPVFHHKRQHLDATPGNLFPKLEKVSSLEHGHPRDLQHHMDGSRGTFAANGFSKPEPILPDVSSRALQPRKLPPGVNAEQVNRALAEIDHAEKSDVEGPGFDDERELYRQKGQKRSLESSRAEHVRRKVGSSRSHLSFLGKH